MADSALPRESFVASGRLYTGGIPMLIAWDIVTTDTGKARIELLRNPDGSYELQHILSGATSGQSVHSVNVSYDDARTQFQAMRVHMVEEHEAFLEASAP